ncbi:MAG: YdbL family protein [Candidatus Brocadiaceae bacterium]
MKLKMWLSFLFILITGSFLTSVLIAGEDISAIKAEMERHIPILNELKAKGIVGEDNKGYLQFIGSKSEKEDVVQDENEDRKKVYAHIAKKEGVTTEQVGQRRAIQIANKAKKGDWLQDSSGKWYQK